MTGWFGRCDRCGLRDDLARLPRTSIETCLGCYGRLQVLARETTWDFTDRNPGRGPRRGPDPASVALGLDRFLTAQGLRLSFWRLRRETRALDGAHRAKVFDALPEHRQREAWDDLARDQEIRRELDWLEAVDDVDSDRYRELLREVDREPLALQAAAAARPRLAYTGRRPGAPRAGTAFRDDDVLRTIPAETYVEALTGEYVPAGGRMRCPLPDHEDQDPSFQTYGLDGWHCFGCHRGGTAIDLAAALDGVEPRGRGYHDLRRRVALALLGEERAA